MQRIMCDRCHTEMSPSDKYFLITIRESRNNLHIEEYDICPSCAHAFFKYLETCGRCDTDNAREYFGLVWEEEDSHVD